MKRRSVEINVAVLALLMSGPYTRADLMKALEAAPRSVYPLIDELHDKCVVYVESWAEVGNQRGRRFIPRYALQPSVGHYGDAPKPEHEWERRVVTQRAAA